MSQLELNKGDNFIFGIDVSASMQQSDTPTEATRIDYAKEQLRTFIGEAAKWDEDGVDVFTFGGKITSLGKLDAANASKVNDLKAQESTTHTHLALQEAYKLHKGGGYKQSVLFLITDGEPSDQQAVKAGIRLIADELKDEHEFAISILTVGKRSTELDKFLVELDDSLNAKHDIVDVKRLEDVNFEEAFAGALHD